MDSSSPWIKAAPAENYQYNVAMQEMQGALSTQGNVQQVAGWLAKTQGSGLDLGARLGWGWGLGLGLGMQRALSGQNPTNQRATAQVKSHILTRWHADTLTRVDSLDD